MLAVLISLMAGFLRLNMALNGPVEYDEPVYFRAAIYYAGDILNHDWSALIHSDYNSEHPPLFKLIDGLVLSQTTHLTEYTPIPRSQTIHGLPDYLSVRDLRLVSAFFGSLAVFFLSLVNPWAGLFLAIDTFAVKYTGIIYLEAIPLCCAILCVETFSKFMEKRKWIWLVLSALACGFILASKYVYIITAIAVLIFFLYDTFSQSLKAKTNQFVSGLVAIAAWGLLSLFFFFLLDPYLWNNPVSNLQHSILFNTGYASQDNPELIKYGYSFWQSLVWLTQSIPHTHYAAPPFYLLPGDFLIAVDEILLPLAFLGLWLMWKNKPIYIFWLFSGLIFLLIWATKWPQYILIILPPYCLAAAYGLKTLFQWIKCLPFFRKKI